MQQHHIKGMLDALSMAGVLAMRDRAKALTTLANYWNDKAVIVWSAADIAFKDEDENGEFIDHDLTEEEFTLILDRIENDHDASLGVSWDTIDHYIQWVKELR